MPLQKGAKVDENQEHRRRKPSLQGRGLWSIRSHPSPPRNVHLLVVGNGFNMGRCWRKGLCWKKGSFQRHSFSSEFSKKSPFGLAISNSDLNRRSKHKSCDLSCPRQRCAGNSCDLGSAISIFYPKRKQGSLIKIASPEPPKFAQPSLMLN